MSFSQKFKISFSDSLASIDDQRDYFVFKVTDGYNDLIDRKFFINIEAGDKMYPMVFNEALELPEDGRRILTTTLLKASGEFLNWWFLAKSYLLERERPSLVDLRLKGIPVIILNYLQFWSTLSFILIRLRWFQKWNQFDTGRRILELLTLKNIVTKFFRNSNFSDFVEIKSEINC